VLFIGNSYTFTHDMPSTLASLGSDASPRVCFDTEAVVHPAFGLRDHRRTGEGAARIAASRWDYVVLQDSSLAPVDFAWDSLDQFRLFARDVRASGARPLLFMTWARAGRPETNAQIEQHFRRAAVYAHAEVAPIGTAWARMRAAHPEVTLYQSDGSHPTIAGTFLGACVLFASMTGRSPEGTHTDVWLWPSSQSMLEHEAWSAMQSPAH
jgi:hypothetical protein